MFSRKGAKAQRKTQENLCAFAPLRLCAFAREIIAEIKRSDYLFAAFTF
jgi:hypothetical protein